MRQAGEPSVEEILESIKKVIARDNRTVATEARREREERGIAPSEARAAPSEGVLDLAALPQFDDTEYDDADFDEGEPAGDDAPETPLLNPASMTSMRDSLAALAMLSEPGVPPQIVRSGETSLEGLTRELLRPALATWLETNLPPLVERLVAAEIARIVGKKG